MAKTAVKVLLFLVIVSLSTFVSAGTCPSGNNTINPDGSVTTIANVGVTGPITGAITSCFFASQATGSDSNSGASEASPWKHVPGMSGCTSTCNSHTPVAGEGFILKGGDTWTATADMNGLIILWSGSSSHPIYYGVDKTWFNAGCGGSWCRPIFNANSVSSNNIFHLVNESWVIIDNIEVTGMRNDINGCQNSGGSDIRCSQLYFHAWSHTGSSNNVGFFAQCGPNSMIDHNIADGADSTKNTMNGVFSSCGGTIQYNYFNFMVSGILATVDKLHFNIVDNAVASADGDHCNGIFIFGPAFSTALIADGNITRRMSCSGGVNFWLTGNSGGCVGCTADAWNNIIEASVISGNVFNIGGHPGDGNTGTYTVYNNTVIALNGGSCMGNGEGPPRSTTNFENNHCIGTSTVCENAGTACNNLGGNVSQSVASANSQGYTSSETQIYSPVVTCTSGTCASVQAGNNLTSSCTGALVSLCSSIPYPTYDATAHTMGVTVATSRPSTGPWDSGVYQLSGSPPPPSHHGVAIVIQ